MYLLREISYKTEPFEKPLALSMSVMLGGALETSQVYTALIADN
jgi:hypothetical protein